MTTEAKKRDVALVVDDSPETLRLLTDALDIVGMTVMVAMDGAAAIRIVDQITPDIILLDAVMPGIDGFETCRRLKREAGLTDVPIIFMTGLTETEHIVRGLEAGGARIAASSTRCDGGSRNFGSRVGGATNALLWGTTGSTSGAGARMWITCRVDDGSQWLPPATMRLPINTA